MGLRPTKADEERAGEAPAPPAAAVTMSRNQRFERCPRGSVGRRTHLLRWALVLLALAAASCLRPAGERSMPPRLAILRFENLGPDPSQDWIGRALEEVVTADLSRARDITVIHAVRIHSLDGPLGPRPVSVPGISAERPAALAVGASRVGYGTYTVAGGRLHVDLSIEDVNTRKMVRMLSASGAPGDVIGVGAALAAGVSSQTTAFDTRSLAALRGYAEAIETADVAQSAPLLEQAIAADPDYGPAYRMLAQLELQHRDREGAVSTLARALSRGNSMGGVERARVAVDLASLQNEPQLKLRALSALVKLDPNDTEAWQALGGLALNRREFAESVAAYRKVLEREPEDFNSWNLLGYAAAYLGDLDTARDAMRHYAGLRPTELNPLDSLGDVNLLCGHFREAEQAYLRAAAKDPNYRNNAEYFKAAMALLWSGDVGGATAVAERYNQARAAARDPLVEFRKAQWTWLTGRRKEACRQMEAFARGSLNDVAPRAWTELAIWELMLGDRAAAQAAADQTARTAGLNGAGAALVTHFLLQPEASSDEWAVRAGQAFPNPQQSAIRNVVLTAALLLGRQYQAASALLKPVVEGGPPEADATAPVLLAWAYLETGRAGLALPLLKSTPAPSLNGPDALLSFSFPRLYYLRGEEAAKQGKRDEARADYRLFLQLSGPDPLMWGEEQKARAGL
jgi:tetratricopeptide (TPR) repeat protein/TolB-like protein